MFPCYRKKFGFSDVLLPYYMELTIFGIITLISFIQHFFKFCFILFTVFVLFTHFVVVDFVAGA